MVGVPFEGVIAAADDTELAGEIGFLRIDGRKCDAVFELRHGEVSLIGLQHVGLTAVDQSRDSNGVNCVAAGVVAELDLRQVFGSLTANHLARFFRVEHAVVARALEAARLGVVHQRAAHVGTQAAVGNDVAIGPHATGHALAHLDGHTGRARIGVIEGHRGVGLHGLGLAHGGFRVRQHGHARRSANGRSVRLCRHCGPNRADGGAYACYAGSGYFQKDAARYLLSHDVSSCCCYALAHRFLLQGMCPSILRPTPKRFLHGVQRLAQRVRFSDGLPALRGRNVSGDFLFR